MDYEPPKYKSVSTEKTIQHDPRFEKIKDFLIELSSGNFGVELEVSAQNDDVDGVMQGLIMLRDELKGHFITEDEAQEQMDRSVRTLLEYSRQNYSDKLQISDQNTVFDGLASGINMLGEYLEETTKNLEQSRQNFQNIFEYANDPIFIMDPATKKIVHVNEQAIKLLGYSAEELLELNLLELRPEEERERSMAQFKAFMRARHAVFESALQHKNGSVIPVEVSARIIQYDGHDVVLSFTRDISERKEKEKKIIESEQRYRTLINTMNEGMMYLDLEDNILFANDHYCKMTGYALDELEGKNAQDVFLLNEEEKSRMKEINLVRNKGISGQYPLTIRKKDGSPLDVRVSSAPVFDSNGKVQGYVGLNTDLTELKRAEKELEESRENFKTLYNRTPAMMHSMDLEGRITSVSKYWLERMGYSEDQVIGKQVSDFLTEDAREYAHQSCMPSLFQKGYCKNINLQFIKKNGEIIETLLSAICENDKDGNVVNCLAVVTDVTLEKQAELALKQSEEKNRALLDANPDVIFRIDREGDYIDFHANPEILILPPERFQNTNVRDTLSESYAKECMELIGKALETGEVQLFYHDHEHENNHYYFEARIVKNGEDEVLKIVRNITEEKEQQEELRKSRERHDAMLDAIPDLLFAFDHNGVFLEYKTENEENLYLSPDQFLGKTARDVMPPEVSRELEKAIAITLKTSELVEFDYELKTPQGNRAFEARVTKAGNDQVLTIIRDLTDQKRTERELIESKERFKSMFELAEFGIALLDDDGKITQVNRKYADTLGYQPDELMDRLFLDFAPENEREQARKNMANLRSGKTSTLHYEKKHLHKNGEIVEMRMAVSRTTLNGVPFSIVMANDITELKKAEEAIKKSEEQFRSLTENAPNFVALVNRDHDIDYINRVGPEYTLEDIIGTSIYNFVDPDEHDMVRQKVDQVFETGEPNSYRSSLTDEEGKGSHYQVYLGAIRDDNEEVNGVIMIVQDITEQVIAKEEIEQAYNELLVVDQISKAASENRPMEKLAELIMDMTVQLGNIRGGWFFAYDQETEELNLLEGRTSKEDQVAVEKKLKKQIRVPMPSTGENSLFKQVVRDQEMLVVRQPDEVIEAMRSYVASPGLKKTAKWAQKAMNVNTFALVPLMTGETVYGLITLYSDKVLDDAAIERIKRFTNNATTVLAKSIAEQHVLAQKQFMDDILNHIPADIAVMDADQRYLFLNNRAVRNEEIRRWMIGKNNYEYCEYKGISNTMAVEREQRFDKALKKKDQVVWVDSYQHGEEEEHLLRKLYPFLEDGRLKYMIGYGVDITDRVLAERESQELAEIVANSNDVIMSVDLNGIILTWNEAGTNLFGYEPEEIIGQSIGIITPQHLEEESRHLSQGVARGNSYTGVETIRMHKDGTELQVSLSLSPLLNKEGRVKAISGIVRDISTRKAAEQALRKSETSLKDAQRLARMGNWEWGVASNTVIWSDGLYHLFEVEKGTNDLTFEDYQNTIHEDEKEAVLLEIFKAFEAKRDYKITYRTKSTGKEKKYVEARGHVELDEAGEVIRMFGTCMDVTERVEAEKVKESFTRRLEEMVTERTAELEVSQNELKYQVDTLNQVALVSITDTEGNITYANERFCDVSGYSYEELIGANHRILKSGKQPDGLFTTMWRAISQGRVWAGEIINKTKNGRFYWVHTTIVPFFNVDGQIEKYVSVRFDITEEKWMQNKLKEALEKEKELGELKSRFVSTASHQFRTPLAVIQSNAELLNMVVEETEIMQKAKLERATARIAGEVTRMTTLMDDVLILGKVTSGKAPVQIKETAFLELCHELAEQFNGIQKDGRELGVNYSGEPRPVMIDAKLIGHAVGNLISNAFKYSQNKNPELTVDYGHDCLLIEVRDWGIGIPEEELDELFQPFHRARNTTEIAGTGLGLAIAKEYVELNNGSIAVKSEVNKETTFTISLPYEVED